MSTDFLILQANRLTETITRALLKFEQLNEQTWNHKIAPEKWSKQEILGHLIDSAVNNHLRFVRAQLAEKEFNSFAYEQEFFIASQNYQARKIDELIILWKAYNLHLAHVIKNIQSDKLDTLCKIGSYEPVRLSFLVADYNDHLEHHLAAILRVKKAV